MNNARAIIVDTSVLAKWFIPDEQSDAARSLKENYIHERLTISLPSLAYYEMNNVFRSAVSKLRMSSKEAMEQFHYFTQLDFIFYTMVDLQEKILEKAIKHDISSYDASYIVLAEYLQIPFITVDQKLLKKATGVLIKDLHKYSWPD